MSVPPRSAAESLTATGEPVPVGKERLTARLWLLLISMLFGGGSIALAWGAVPTIWLPLQVQALVGEDGKGVALSVVTGVSGIAAVIAQPLAGMLSDRTRTRFGRRGPWLIGGALVGGIGMVALGAANGLVWLVAGWAVVTLAYNFAQGPFSAILPDRVPAGRYGLFAAIGGFGGMLGSLGGTIVGASFADMIPVGYLVFAGIILIVMTLFVVLNPDVSNRGEPRPAWGWKRLLSSYWVNPIQNPDFFWGFVSRFAFVGGYFVITGYQLYILQDYVGVGEEAVALVPALSGLSLLGIVVSILVSGPLSDAIGRRKPLVAAASFILAGAAAAPLVWASVPGMLVFAVLSGIGFGMYMGVDQALMASVLPSEADHGKDLGVLNIAQALPQTAAAAVAGVVLTATGQYVWLFPIAIAAALIGGFAVFRIRSVR